jgi:hypothetical protein
MPATSEDISRAYCDDRQTSYVVDDGSPQSTSHPA